MVDIIIIIITAVIFLQKFLGFVRKLQI